MGFFNYTAVKNSTATSIEELNDFQKRFEVVISLHLGDDESAPAAVRYFYPFHTYPFLGIYEPIAKPYRLHYLKKDHLLKLQKKGELFFTFLSPEYFIYIYMQQHSNYSINIQSTVRLYMWYFYLFIHGKQKTCPTLS